MMYAIKLFCFVVGSLVLSACSFQSEFFIQNRSTNEVLVTVTYTMPLADFIRKEDQMDYLPKRCNPRQYRKDREAMPLTFTQRSDSTLSFLVPASSTARIESTLNADFTKHIREIAYNGKHLSAEALKAASRKYAQDYVYTIK